MSGKKLSKEDLKSPDAFKRAVSSFGKALAEYGSVIKFAVVALIAIAVVWTGYSMYQSKIEEEAQSEYFQVEKKILKKKTQFFQAKSQKKSKEKPASGDLQKDYGSELAELEVVMKKHPSTVAGQLAAMSTIDIYNEYNAAQVGLEKVSLLADQEKGSGLFSGLLKLQLGNLYAQNQKCKEALNQWQPVLANSDWDFLHSRARLKMGVCYESLNKTELAKKMYQEVRAEAPNSSLGKMAATYLRTL